MKTEIKFTERQHFTQWWLWMILIGIIATTSYGAISQHLSDEPGSDTGLLFSLLIFLLVIILFRTISLTTQITDEGIMCKLFPFHLSFRVFKWTDIANCHVRKYKPLLEYGGWGLKYGTSGLAYNISGNMGIQLELQDGRKILIGTQQPEEVERVLLVLKNKSGENKQHEIA
ncbi:MAG: hypothetical protein ACK5AO_00995 [bacterium]|jgi:hypothetical protein